MTNKTRYYLLTLASLLLLTSCSKRLEQKLLEPRSYFEETYVPMEVRSEKSITYALKTRVSTPIDDNVRISYLIGDATDVEAYNKRNGTNYLLFPVENALLSKSEARITSGGIYSEPAEVTISGLENVEAGKTFLLPIRFQACKAAPAITSAQTLFLALQKPVQLTKAAHFKQGWSSGGGNWISLPRLTDETFESVTYEALIYPESWSSGNSTVMGKEGALILRVGDTGGGLASNKIQIAGNKQFHYDTGLATKRWYHVAFTFNHNSGKATIYINGKPVANGDWDKIADIREGFAVGQVPHFMWGTRPFSGYMAEVRLWNVARTENELQQNMLKVDPKTTGLVVYYHLDGTDVKQVDGKWKVIDATPKGYHGEPNDGKRELPSITLPTPIEAKDIK